MTPIFTDEGYRVVLGRPTKIGLYLDDAVGTLVDADDATDVACVLADGAGAEISTTTVPAASSTEPGVYEVTVPARQLVDRLVATWTAVVDGAVRTVTQPVDVVAQHILDLRRLAEDDDFDDLSPMQLARLVDLVEQWFDAALGYPCVVRGDRVSFWAGTTYSSGAQPPPNSLTGLPLLAGPSGLAVPGVLLPVALYAVSINGTAVAGADLSGIAVRDARFQYADGRPWGYGQYEVHVAHGDLNPPQDIRKAAFDLAREVCRSTNYPQRATSVSTDKSTITFTLPTPDRPTGIPSVDGVLMRRRNPLVIV